MPSNTENVKLGVCDVIFDGVVLGLTKGGVEVEITTESHEVTVDQYGPTPIGEIIMGRKVMAKVPLAETTLENVVAIMPGASLVSDGDYAEGTVTFSTAAPVDGDSVTLYGTTFTFKTTPTTLTDMPIPASINEAAALLAARINTAYIPFSAVASGAVTTITARTQGTDLNSVMTKDFATTGNCTLVGMAGGDDPTAAKVIIPTGTNINLLSIAKTLVLRPRGTYGAEDVTIHKAACPGAMSFAFNFDQERVFNAEFKGYVDPAGNLLSIGDVTATG